MTKSDGGSVGSNLKKLSIDAVSSPLLRAKTRNHVLQVPEGTSRPLKRSQLLSTGTIHRSDVESPIALNDDNDKSVDEQPGVIQLPRPLAPRAYGQTSSDAALDTGNDDFLEPIGKMLLQPETRPITQDQLVNEVKGIYAGLIMVEKKCVKIGQQQSMTMNKLSDEQWQALIALYRTLLYEHHDFFLASQHPSSSAALRRLATKYAMPARMWRHGIHSFLELLRHRLPDSLDHMLAFVYLVYSMMALLMESVPSSTEMWIEPLGDLARYRMAIEDHRDREIWSGHAKMWYEKAADRSHKVGRIQHHLAILARPNIVQQLFYYSKDLVIGRSGVDESHLVGDEVPQQLPGMEIQLPEDFPLRELICAKNYFPDGFFEDQMTVDEDERTLDLPSHAPPRAERCSWLGFQIVSVSTFLSTLICFLSNVLQLDGWLSNNLPFALTEAGVCGWLRCAHESLSRLLSSDSGMGIFRLLGALLKVCSALKLPLQLKLVLSVPGAMAYPIKNRLAEDTGRKLFDLLQDDLIELLRWIPCITVSALVICVVNSIARRATDDATRKQTFAIWTGVCALAGLICGDKSASDQLRITTIFTGGYLLVQYWMVLFPEQRADLRWPILFLTGGISMAVIFCHMMASSTGVDSAVFLQFLLPSFWIELSAASYVPPTFSWLRVSIIRLLQ